MSYTPGGPTTSLSSAGFQDVTNSWITVLSQPALAKQNLVMEVPRNTQNRIILSVGSATVISGLLGAIGGIFSVHVVGEFLRYLIVTPLSFFFGVAALYIGARTVQGRGVVSQQAWVQSTYWAPILILSSLPLVGWIA